MAFTFKLTSLLSESFSAHLLMLNLRELILEMMCDSDETVWKSNIYSWL
jgi:hypothetical protein